MHSSFPNPPYVLLFAILLLHVRHTEAQIGLATQDLTTISGYSLQKACAQSCFVKPDAACPYDVIGSKIGCQTWDCHVATWLATNDCYCRTDLQQPALDFISSCVSKRCTVGDNRKDASTAAGLYAQYCKGKGYETPTAPARNSATTTGTGIATGAGVFDPPLSATGTSTSESSSPGGGSKLSLSTIIGIVVGSLAGLAFLAVAIKTLLGVCRNSRNKTVVYSGPQPMESTQPMQPMQPPQYQQPAASFPRNHYHGAGEVYPRPSPNMEQEVEPDDSVSMVSGGPRNPPTLVSAAHYPPRRW